MPPPMGCVVCLERACASLGWTARSCRRRGAEHLLQRGHIRHTGLLHCLLSEADKKDNVNGADRNIIDFGTDMSALL